MIELQPVVFAFLNNEYEVSVPDREKFWAFKLPDCGAVIEVIVSKEGGVGSLKTLTSEEAAKFEKVVDASILDKSRAFQSGKPRFTTYSLRLRDGRVISAELRRDTYNTSAHWVQRYVEKRIRDEDVVGWRIDEST